MSEPVFISPTNLPEPHNLVPHWFELLGLTEDHRRHLSHLRSAEVRLIEAARLVIRQYTDNGDLQDGKTTAGIIRRLGQEIDRHWLKPGRGRAVDVKSVIETLEAYAKYREWAKLFVEPRRILDVKIPYWMFPPDVPLFGGGVMSLDCVVREATLGRIGEAHWHKAHISMSEMYLRPHHQEEEVDLLALTREGRPDDPHFGSATKTLGLVNWLGPNLHPLVARTCTNTAPERLEAFKHQSDYSRGEVHLANPTQKTIQQILDDIGMLVHPYRHPSGLNLQLVFDVAPDLSQITKRMVETDHWLSRAELPPLPPTS